MTTILTLLYITLLVVFVVDLSGFMSSLKDILSKVLKVSAERIRIKPLDCSLCLSFWAQIIYLLLSQATLVYYVIAIAFSFLTPIFADLFYGIKEVLGRITRKIK